MKTLHKTIFVTGISTDVGKTVASAVLTEALQADYWKPIQCGGLEHSDSDVVRSLCSHNPKIFPETFRLKLPQSPHWAAKEEGVTLRLSSFQKPETDRPLVIEGAGGALVPLNEREYLIDLARIWEIPAVVVVSPYLGCINHSCLTLEALERREIRCLGLILNGDFAPEVRSFLQSKAEVLFAIPQLKTLHPEAISELAHSSRLSLFDPERPRSLD